MGAIITAAVAFMKAYSVYITIASIAYQVVQARKMKKAAREASEARKGFEVVVEGEAVNLPIVYGRAKVGGARVYHNVTNNYSYVTPNSDKVLQTAGLDGDRSGEKNEFLLFQQALCQGPINNVYDVVFEEGRYLNDPDIGSSDLKWFDYGYTDESGSFFSNLQSSGSIKSALRIDLHYGDSPTADAIASANFGERSTAVFDGLAYASTVIKLNRDEPQFNTVPMQQFLIEGKKVRTINLSGGVYSLNSTRIYTNNPAYCLLDYLLDTSFGKGLSVSQIDLKSFYDAAQICNTVVQTNVTVGGKIFNPTLGGTGAAGVTGSTRNINLYECNIVVDTQKAVRENVESILATMGDARLVWSAGSYKLNMQYPATNSAISVAATLTDNDLVMDDSITINWPTSSERLNNCTVRFHNESEGFKEDTVSWPPKTTGTFLRGVGGFKYPLAQQLSSGGDAVSFMNAYGVWNGSGDETTVNYKMVVKETGTYLLEYDADDALRVIITGGSLNFDSGVQGNWTVVKTANINLVKDTIYTVNISANNSGGGEKSVAAKLSRNNYSVWTTRSDAYTSFIVVNTSSAVYDAMKTEDSDLELETDIFADGITDYYHALAKAEELVRTSRTAFGIKFKYIIKDKFLEPGDFIRLSSETLKLGLVDPVYFRVNEVKVTDGSLCEVTATRFDYTQLAWNQKDDEYLKPVNLYDFKNYPVSNLTYVAESTNLLNSSGKLTWTYPDNTDFSGFRIYMYIPGDVNLDNSIRFIELGKTSENSFVLPAITSDTALFGVRVEGKTGKLSDIALTGVVAIIKSEPLVIYSIEPSFNFITLNSTQTTFAPSTITFSSYSTSDGSATTLYTGRIFLESSITGATWSEISNNAGVSSVNFTTSALANTTRFIRATLYDSTDTQLARNVINVVADGANGSIGNSVYVATVYRQQTGTAPTAPSATSSTYDFATNTLTPPAGWSVSQPATTTTPTYACDYTFAGAPSSTVTGIGTWSAPYVEAVAGANGEYRDVIQLYLTSSTTPTKPDSVPYTFSSNTIGTQAGGTAGWSLTRPTATTTPTYITSALAATTTPTLPLALTAWSNPVIAAQVGTNGIGGVAAYLTNPTHDLLANPSGVVYSTEYAAASTNFVIVEGGTASTGWTYHVSAVSANIAYKDADDANGRTGIGAVNGLISALPLSISNLTADSGYIDITATKTGYSNITLRFSVTRISESVDGISPVLVNITGQQAIAYDKDGITPSPSSITFTATSKNTTGNYYYRFKVDGTVLGSIITSSTGSATSSSYVAPTSYFSTPKIILVEISTASDMSAIVDTDTMSLVSSRVGATGSNGSNGIAAYLTNPTHDLLANPSGTVYSAEYTAASTNFIILEGGSVSTGWSYYVSAISSGVNYKDADDATGRTGIGATNGAINVLPLSISSLTADSGYVDITATKTGFSNITLRFSVTRISEAADGVSPILVDISGPQAISYDKDGLTPSPASITFNATGKNVTGTYYYRFKVDGVDLGTVITSSTGSATSASYTPPTSHFTTPKIISVEISATSNMAVILDTDTMSLVASRVGATGSNGLNGVGAYLTNPTHDLLANASGTVYSTEYASASTNFVIVEGGTVSTGWTYYVSAIGTGVSYKDVDDTAGRTGIGATNGAISALPLSISSLTVDSGYVDITATKTGYSNITLRFSVTRISEAIDGVSPILVELTGQQAVTYAKDGSTPSPTTISFTGTGKNVTGNYYYRFKVDGTVVGNVITSSTGSATSGTYTVPTSYFETPKVISVEISDVVGMTNILDTDTMSLIATKPGLDGVSPYIGDLSNDNHTLPASSAGVVSSYSGASGVFSLFREGTAVANAVFEYSSSTGFSTAPSTSINASTGAYSITGVTTGGIISSVSDVATVTYVAKVGGTIVSTQTFSISKQKAAVPGAAAVVYYIDPSYANIKLNSTQTTFSPTSVAFNAYSISGSALPAAYPGRILLERSTNGSTWTEISNTLEVSSVTLTTSSLANTVRFIRVTLYNASDVQLDREIINVVVDGATGATGSAARSVVLSVPTGSQAFTYNTAGTTPSPTTIDLTATAFNTTGTVYYEFFKNGDSAAAASTTATYTYTPDASFTNMPQKVEVVIREGSATGTIVARDTMTLFGVMAGEKAITINLSNTSKTLSANSAGTVASYDNTGISIQAYEGSTPIPYGTKFTVTAAGTSITPGAASTSTDTFSRIFANASAMTASDAKITFTISVTNSAGVASTFVREQTFSKSIAGNTGATGSTGTRGTASLNNSATYNDPGTGNQTVSSVVGQSLQTALNSMYTTVADRTPKAGDIGVLFNSLTKSVSLSSNNYVVTYSGVTPSVSSIILTGTAFNVESTFYYSFFKNGVQIGATSTLASYTVPVGAYVNASDLFTVTIRDGSATGEVVASDSISVYYLKTTSEVTVVATNTTHELPIGSTGTVASYANSGITFSVYDGTTPLTYGTTGAAGTYQVSAVVSVGTITLGTPTTVSSVNRVYPNHSGLSGTSATISFTVTVKNLLNELEVYIITQNVSKALKGNVWSRTFYFDGTNWTSLAQYIDGNSVITGTLSVGALKSGAAGVNTIGPFGQPVTGNFKLGSGERTPIGNAAAIGSFTAGNNSTWALGAFNTNTISGNYGNGLLASTSSPGGAAIGCYSLANQYPTTTNLKYASVFGETGAAGYGIGLKTSSYTQQAVENNLPVRFRSVDFFFGKPNYICAGTHYGQLENLGTTPGLIDPESQMNIGVVVVELGYCSDDQTQSYAGLFVRRHISGVNKGQEASRVVIAPSSAPTRAIEVSGGGTYVGTVAHFPGGLTSFTGVHESQSEIELPIGDIVIDGDVLYKQDIANVFNVAHLSTVAKDKRVVGVVAYNSENEAIPYIPDTTTGGVLAHGYTGTTVEVAKELEEWKMKYTILVNAVGEGQVNVCGENGNIEVGDLIVSSSIAGKGMKQDDDLIRSYTVAKARESVTFDSPTQVKMIACTYLCG